MSPKCHQFKEKINLAYLSRTRGMDTGLSHHPERCTHKLDDI